MAISAPAEGEKPVLWITQALLEKRRELPGRPEHYEDLLIEPIVDDVANAGDDEKSYDGWEVHHAEARRFYLAGLTWFTDTFRAKQKTLDLNRDDAHRRVIKFTKWHTMRDPEGYWKSELGRPQVLNVFQGQAVPFAKAAQLLMAAEIVVEKILGEQAKDPEAFAARGIELPPGFDRPEHIHRYMGILPACWNIDNFNEKYVERVRRATSTDPHIDIADALGLRSHYAVADLTRGHTVTRRVAEHIHRTATEKYQGSDFHLGRVRAKPGNRSLGQKSASKDEGPDLL